MVPRSSFGMANGIEPKFIPNPDLLFCRVHRSQFNAKENRIARAVFDKPQQSVDWEKYSTEGETISRHKKPQDVRGIACITAGACRNLTQEVVHVPLGSDDSGGPNEAHSEIRGEKTPEILSQLRDAVARFWRNPKFLEISR